MLKSVNTIRNQSLHFQYNGKADGFALQKEVSDWCRFTLIPEIEEKLEPFALADNYITIDKLVIDATVDKKDWQQKLRNELISSLNRKLSSFKPVYKKPETGQKNEPLFYKLDELILFYFEKGYLPWWSKAVIDDNFDTILFNWITEDKSQSRASHIIFKLQQISSRPVIQRILNQVPDRIFFTFLKNIFKKEAEIIRKAESFFNEILKAVNKGIKEKAISGAVYEVTLATLIKNNGKLDIGITLKAFHIAIQNKIGIAASALKALPGKASLSANPFEKTWQKLLTEEIQNNVDKNMEAIRKENKLKYRRVIDQLNNKSLDKKNKEQVAEDLQEGIYIENAGAVIVAAFLPVLFERLKITAKAEIIKPSLGALMIQYIVSGKTKAEEHELLLPKILCGISPELPVNTNKRISATQKNEADEMLRSVIEHWTTIKNTSVDGLRESFLQRSGKLILLEDEWLLQVEQKSFDMLLQQLPWNISMIKLPWMKNLLKTEWV